MHLQTTIKDTVLDGVSQNVQGTDVIETVEELSVESLNAAIKNHNPFPYFDEYREFEL